MNKNDILGMVKKTFLFLTYFLPHFLNNQTEQQKTKEDLVERAKGKLTISLESFGVSNPEYESENAKQS